MKKGLAFFVSVSFFEDYYCSSTAAATAAAAAAIAVAKLVQLITCFNDW